MKKLLGLAITLALVIPSGLANAELFKNLKATGNIDVQGVSVQNATDFSTMGQALPASNANDRVSTVMTRVVAGLGWDLLDDVHAKITLRKNDRAWGTQGAAGQMNTTTNDQAISGATGLFGTTFINEASVKVDKLFGALDTTVGRQFWGNSGDLIAAWGPKNNYGLYVTAIDAVSAMYANDMIEFAGIAGKAVDAPIGTAANAAIVNDTTATGIDVGVKKLPVKANVFIWNAVTHANGQLGTAPGTASTPGLNDNLWVYGAKLRAEGMGAWINATVALNAGTNRTVTAGITYPTAASANYSGKALLLDLGYKADISNVGGITPWANFGWGSGRHDVRSNKNEGFAAISSDYRPGVIYGRFNQGALALGSALPGGAVSAAGLGNRQIWGAGLKATPAGLSKLTAGVSYWDFNYQYATLGATGVSAANGNRHIGSEFDLQIDWAHSENVVLDAGWAVFNPGGYVKEQNRTTSPVTGTNSVNMLFADLGIKF